MLDLKTTQTESRDEDVRPDTGRKYEAKIRKCLMCGTQFPSEWAGERICRKCRSSSTWRRG
jgi:hypothetical protein